MRLIKYLIKSSKTNIFANKFVLMIKIHYLSLQNNKILILKYWCWFKKKK